MDTTKPICVTGASGYIASWIVRFLLEQGFTVHATVRNLNNEQSVAHLKKAAQGQPGVLKLFNADLLKEGSFDAAIKGCELVIHTASPFIIKGFKDAHEALVRPAVEGTANVLYACTRIETVKRVVLTSTVASVYGDSVEARDVPNATFTEAHWNNTSSEHHQPYSYSKVAAERKAWDICRQQSQWDLVTINPSLVVGPSLTTLSQSTSMDVIKDLGSGRQRTGVPHLELGVVDVREVAQAHIQAGLNPKAKGRYIVSNQVVSLLDMAKIIREKFAQYPLPTMQLPKLVVKIVGPVAAGISREFIEKNVGYRFAFDNQRSQQELGIQYRPLSQSLHEHFQQMIDDGLLKRR